MANPSREPGRIDHPSYNPRSAIYIYGGRAHGGNNHDQTDVDPGPGARHGLRGSGGPASQTTRGNANSNRSLWPFAACGRLGSFWHRTFAAQPWWRFPGVPLRSLPRSGCTTQPRVAERTLGSGIGLDRNPERVSQNLRRPADVRGSCNRSHTRSGNPLNPTHNAHRSERHISGTSAETPPETSLFGDGLPDSQCIVSTPRHRMG